MICYLLVFQGSTPITEWISGGKYPEYKLYQQWVGMFLPLGPGWKEDEAQKAAPRLAEEQKKKHSEHKAKK